MNQKWPNCNIDPLSMGARVDDDDDNLIGFPPMADDNSYFLIYFVHI